MRHATLITLTLSTLNSACGGIDLDFGPSAPTQEMRFLREAQDVRLQVGTTLQASSEDDPDLVDLPLPLDQYNRVTCAIGEQEYTHCYSSSNTCGGGAFPTACFDDVGGLRGCVRGANAIPKTAHCVGTTRDAMGVRGGPLEVVYCGVLPPAGRKTSGWVECE